MAEWQAEHLSFTIAVANATIMENYLIDKDKEEHNV